MVWLPDGEKNFEDTFIRFDTIHERDRHTYRQTPHDGIGRAYASHRAAKSYLRDSEKSLVIRLGVLTQYRHVTYTQTDRRTSCDSIVRVMHRAVNY